MVKPTVTNSFGDKNKQGSSPTAVFLLTAATTPEFPSTSLSKESDRKDSNNLKQWGMINIHEMVLTFEIQWRTTNRIHYPKSKQSRALNKAQTN